MRHKKIAMLVLLACVLLASSFVQGQRLLQARGESERVELRDAPPMVMFSTVVLGGFKGILADILWLRASLLQDEGRYLELVQLSDWITKLEPHIAEIWAFHAWNMTYNVSVMMPKPDDRWRWVRNGISLLRDQGTVYNPGDPKLYFELAWFFQHKLGGTSDTMHLYYKKQWATEMSSFLGPDGLMDYDTVSDEMSKKLLDEYRLDVDVIKQLDEEYGPLDWRLPEANAVYWGSKGARSVGKGYISCDRVVYQSMMQIFRRGKLTFDPETEDYRVGFNPDVLPGVMKAFESAIAKHPGEQTIPDSYALFLREAVRSLHMASRDDDARRIFAKLALEYADHDTKKGYEAFLNFKYDEQPPDDEH